MKVRGEIGLGLASVLLGMLLVFQFRAGTGIRRNLPYRDLNQLASYVHRLETESARAKDLEEEIRKLQRQAELDDYDEELRDLRLASGLFPLCGPGLEIVLVDSGREGRAAFMDPNLLLVHYDQLLFLVNELWVAGAEAVAVNGERVVAQTGFTCAGSIILAGTKKVAPPYVIQALGDPKTLRAALTMPGGFIETQILPYELGMTITEKDDLRIPAYQGGLVFESARLLTDESELMTGEGEAGD